MLSAVSGGVVTAKGGKGAIERDDGKSLKDFSIANAQPDVSQCDDFRALVQPQCSHKL